MIQVYVDGCRKRDGRGAWAAIIMLDKPVLMGGFSPETTNNIMELSGPMHALDHLNKIGFDGSVHITSDAQYFVDGFNSWMHSWQRRGWKRKSEKSKNDEVKNLALWKNLFHLKKSMSTATAEWVRGHSGHRENELCDKFANILCSISDSNYFEMRFANSLEEIELYINSASDFEKDLKTLTS